MNMPSDKKKWPALWQDVAVFLAVLALSAHLFRLFVGVPPPVTTPAHNPAFQRSPASETPVAAVKEHSTKSIDIGCLGSASPRPQSTSAGLLQIQMSLCGQVDGLQATNESTKEKLLVFLKESRATTHYFPLKEGQNRIQLRWLGPKKRELGQVIEVERQAPGT